MIAIVGETVESAISGRYRAVPFSAARKRGQPLGDRCPLHPLWLRDAASLGVIHAKTAQHLDDLGVLRPLGDRLLPVRWPI
jgi:hypothetical protein